tara:strand:+ start:65 stop:193 length:129 start_codon:yes stop_codon:yes gene_type:complete
MDWWNQVLQNRASIRAPKIVFFGKIKNELLQETLLFFVQEKG